MKKILSAVLLSFFVSLFAIPSFVSAQSALNTDVDEVGQSCQAVLTMNMRYKMRDSQTNNEVSALQDFLNTEGYLASQPTGYFGLATFAAVKKFQQASGYSPTGFVGPLTRAKVNAMSCDGGTTTVPTQTTQVVTPVTTVATTQPQPTYSNPNLPAGCASSAGFSTLTGMRCFSDTPSITVINPNGGGYWYKNTTTQFIVQWKSSNIPKDSQILIRLRSVDTNQEYNLTTTNNEFGDEPISVTYNIPLGAYYIEVKTSVNGQSYMDSSDQYIMILDSVNTSSVPTVEFIGTPTLSLQYDSVGKESMLKGVATVKVTAGSLPVTNFSFISNILQLNKNGSGSVHTNSMNYDRVSSSDVILGDALSKIPANGSATFVFKINAPTKELFAGSYNLNVYDFQYSNQPNDMNGSNNSWQILPSSSFKNAQSSNSITIIGETSPYISDVTDTGYHLIISGARLDLLDNYLQIDGRGNSMISKYSPTSTKISILKSSFALTSDLTSIDMHYVKITNIKTGDSNGRYFAVNVVSVPTACTVTAPDATVGVNYTYTTPVTIYGAPTVALPSGLVANGNVISGITNIPGNYQSKTYAMNSCGELTINFKVVSPPVTATSTNTSKIYLNGSTYPNIQTNNITRVYALESCMGNHNNNPSKSIRCMWGEEEIYTFQPITTPTPSISLNTYQTSVAYGGSATINWSASNVAYCTLSTGSIDDYGAGAAPLSGSKTLSNLTSSRTATLSCPSTNGTAITRTVTINVTAPVVTSTATITITTIGSVTNLTQPGVSTIVKGNSGVDIVNVSAGASLDFTQAGLGIDEIHLAGNFSDYTKTYSGSVVTMTRTYGSNTETIVVLSGDKVYFANGSTTVLDILNFLKGLSGAPVLVQASSTPVQAQLASVIDAFAQAPASTPAPVWAYTWNRNLEVNSQYADDVSALQTALTKEGVFTGDVTGGFYSQTYLAVKALQTKYGIESTGFVGPITRAKLNELY